MTTNHIDQLAQWWENAERGAIRAGDTVIQNHRTAPDEYTVYVAEQPSQDSGEHVRILARAPKPKPAWHDAAAVIATGDVGDCDWITGVWVPDGTPAYWESTDTGIILGCEKLSDVTPLIEAKVTDEMMERYWAAMRNPGSNYDEAVRHALAAALGIEERS